MHDALVGDDAHDAAPGVQVTTLGEGDQTLGQGPQPLGLRLRRLDPAMLEQGLGQVGEHDALVRRSASEPRALGGRRHGNFSLRRRAGGPAPVGSVGGGAAQSCSSSTTDVSSSAL